MRPLGERINQIFTAHMIYFMLVAMLVGWWLSASLNLFRDAVPWLFGYMTFVTALKTSWRDLGSIFRKPLPLLTIVVFQHLAMPFLAKFMSGALFPDNPQLITGFVLASALPVGITAVIWTGMAKGDVALSLTSATIDTLISPITISLVLMAFVGQKVEINYTSMMIGLVKMIVIPSVLGLTVNDWSRGTFHSRYIPYLGPVSSLCLCAVIMVNVGTAQATAAKLAATAPMLVVATMVMVLSGFFIGWLLPRLLKFDESVTTSCIFCAGIRNTSAGLVIAIGHLPIQASIPILIAMFFQQPAAAIMQKLRIRRQLKA